MGGPAVKGLALALGLLVATLLCGRVSATHFRYTTMSWSRTPSSAARHLVNFTVNQAWRAGGDVSSRTSVCVCVCVLLIWSVCV